MKAKSKLDRQVNVRLSLASYERIERLSQAEKRESAAEVIRILIDWILPHLRESDTLTLLTRGIPSRRYSRRVSEELQDQLHSALDVIFERAPSEVVNEVARKLTAWAGKYGDEK